MKNFIEWSVSNWFVYSIIGIFKWRNVYSWVCSLLELEVNSIIGLLLICFQLFGLAMSFVVIFTIIKRNKNR